MSTAPKRVVAVFLVALSPIGTVCQAAAPGSVPSGFVPASPRSQAATLGEAELELGLDYDLGQHTGKDTTQACAWYQRAGEHGVAAGAFNMGVMQDRGLCGERDLVAAAVWYGRAAALGHGRAQYNLAQLYEAGMGVPRNFSQAVSWYRAAALSGITAAVAKAAEPTSKTTQASQAALRSVVLATPVAGAIVEWNRAIALVWSAPEQPGPVAYFVEMDEVGPTQPREVLTRYTELSATAVELPASAATYTWRISTIDRAHHRYALSGWQMLYVLAEAGH